jgi:squalene synthase HpnC
MRRENVTMGRFPDSTVIVLRRARQVTGASLFAFISELCPNRQVTGAGVSRARSSGTAKVSTGEVSTGEASRGGAGIAEADDREEAAAAVSRVDSPPGAAAQISLAVAAKASAENFPVALRVLPKRWRAHLTALYGFARLTDDIGDEPLPGMPHNATRQTITATRLRLLDELQSDVARIYDDKAPEPDLQAVRDLKRTVKDCAIPAQPFYDLIQANRQDQLVTRYDTYSDLDDYCKLSANPVGQAVLYIMKAATPDRLRASDSICTALQIIEHTQDVAEDLANGRIYLPRQDMDAYRVTEADLAEKTASTEVRDLVRFEADRAKRLLDEGAPLVGTLKGAARLAIAGYVAGGRATLKAIEAGGYDVLRSTPRPGKADTLVLMASCYFKGR